MRIAIIAMLALAMTACDDTPTGPTTGSFTISGRVLNFTTQLPVAAADVRFTEAESPTSLAVAIADANGRYSITMPLAGQWIVSVNGGPNGIAEIFNEGFAGDMLVDTGNCVARYGTIVDARTGRGIRGATVTLLASTVTTNNAGRYMLALGCESNTGFSTTFMSVSHPDYQSRSQVVGRGVQGVSRLDVKLEKKD
jgi:hypothetical protein